MGLFDNMLKAGESLFKNEEALDYEFVPKEIPFRENQQQHIATCIKPLFSERQGKNLLIYGPPGIGKTVAMKHVFRELEEKTDDIIPLYVNCWQKNTTYKILVELLHQIGYRFTQNKKTDELLQVLEKQLKSHSAVFAFDEVDKVTDFDFLYFLVENIPHKCIFLITNYKEKLTEVDERIVSRLTPELLEFRAYNAVETSGILKQRLDYAFVPGVWNLDALEKVCSKTFEMNDIRSGLYLLREAGNIAEGKSVLQICLDHADEAIAKLNEFKIKKAEALEAETQRILSVVKEHSGNKIGELYKLYQAKDGKGTYKTFQRKIDSLAKNSFISVDKTKGGTEGNTTIVHYSSTKKLTDF
ncbi:MAG: Cdc6/Cdc18 family protein [Candidatus Nanoarchaeia archaeon]